MLTCVERLSSHCTRLVLVKLVYHTPRIHIFDTRGPGTYHVPFYPPEALGLCLHLSCPTAWPCHLSLRMFTLVAKKFASR